MFECKPRMLWEEENGRIHTWCSWQDKEAKQKSLAERWPEIEQKWFVKRIG